ncbi:hypothetical protein ACSBR2_012583 [Camellia fascicularis]
MASARRLLTLFPNLHDSPIENVEASTSEPRQSALVPALAPILSFPELLVKKTMAAQSDIDVNHYTLKSCVETATAVSNLSHLLKNRTSEVHRLNTQLSLLQRMYKDAREEIDNLKKQNKELKRQVNSVVRFEGPSYSLFEGRRRV